MKWVNSKITIDLIMIGKDVPPVKISNFDFIMHVYLIVKAHEVLSKNKDGDKDHKKESCMPVDILVGCIEYEEKQVAQVIDCIQPCNSPPEEEKQGNYLNISRG